MSVHAARPIWKEWWMSGRPGAMTYMDYVDHMAQWVEEKGHSGPKPSTSLANYTKLNAARMRRVGKTLSWPNEMDAILEGLPAGHRWVLITESWCGDAAQAAPLIWAMAEKAGIPLDVVLRDGETRLMDEFLRNGGRSIPVWICASKEGEVLTTWGPRPHVLQNMWEAYRAAPEPKKPKDVFSREAQEWYNRDKGHSFFEDAMAMLSEWGGGAC